MECIFEKSKKYHGYLRKIYIFHLALFFILPRQNFIFVDVIGFKLGKNEFLVVILYQSFKHI